MKLRQVFRIFLLGLAGTFLGMGMSPAQAQVYTWTNFADGTGSGSPGHFFHPFALAVDTSGNIYVADSANYAVRKVTPGGVVTTLAGGNGEGFMNGPGNVAQFAQVGGLALDAAGNIYIADGLNYAIRKVSPAGVVTTLAGGNGLGYTDGPANVARFSATYGGAVDSAGNFYTADWTSCAIRKVSPAGRVTTLAGGNGEGFTDGPGNVAQFRYAYSLAVDSEDNIYVADAYNFAIRKVTPAGVVTTLAGNGTQGYADGTGSGAQFMHPEGVAVDAAGNVYVGDFGGRTIRKITPSGVVTTIGGAPGLQGNVEGAGPAARLHTPAGVAVDPAGTLYAADYNGNLLWRGASDAPGVLGVFTVASDWSAGFQGRLVVGNPAPRRIETWSLRLQLVDRQITQIWGADIASVTSVTTGVMDDLGAVIGQTTIRTYKLAPPDWNKRIAPGGSVEVGFLGSPGNVRPGAVRVAASSDLSHSAGESAAYTLAGARVAVSKEGDWQTGATLKFRITNLGATPLTDWRLETDFARPVQSIWNATVRSSDGVTLTIDARDFPWQKDIPTGGTVEFGMISAPGALTTLPLATSISSTTPPPPAPPEPGADAAAEPDPAGDSATSDAGAITLVVPSTLSVKTRSATAAFKVVGEASVQAKANRRAVATVKAGHPYKLTMKNLSRGRTKVWLTAAGSEGGRVRKTINVIRR